MIAAMLYVIVAPASTPAASPRPDCLREAEEAVPAW